MIILIAPTFDTASPVLLPGSAGDKTREMSRRVSRRATLDGAAVAPDYGYCAADRTFTLDIERVPLATRREVERLLQSYARVVVATDEGHFIGALSSLTSTLTVLVMEQLD